MGLRLLSRVCVYLYRFFIGTSKEFDMWSQGMLMMMTFEQGSCGLLYCVCRRDALTLSESCDVMSGLALYLCFSSCSNVSLFYARLSPDNVCDSW